MLAPATGRRAAPGARRSLRRPVCIQGERAMRTGVDTNVLVYAHVPGLPQHAAARAFLRARLEQPSTAHRRDPDGAPRAGARHHRRRRFDPPVPMEEALEVARRYLGRSNVECLAVDEAAMAGALELLERHQLGRRRVADCLLAATLLRHGVTELATYNADDFRGFEGLTVVVPA
ncbi:MAG: PIN domain-containing protein [Desulfobacterales bacterium]|nr:PIN domain-containing protein [Desulfobacterales bacterium]